VRSEAYTRSCRFASSCRDQVPDGGVALGITPSAPSRTTTGKASAPQTAPTDYGLPPTNSLPDRTGERCRKLT